MGSLAAEVQESVQLAARQSFSAAGPAAPGREGVTPNRPAAPDSGARSLAAASRLPWWPTYGNFDSFEFTRQVRRGCVGISIGPCLPGLVLRVDQRRVRLEEGVLWSAQALRGFDGRWAYEHDLKITSPSRSGRRPVCNPGSSGRFYALRDGVKWESGFPDRSAPYFDTALSDSFSEEDLTVGVAFPERLDDGRPGGLEHHRLDRDRRAPR